MLLPRSFYSLGHAPRLLSWKQYPLYRLTFVFLVTYFFLIRYCRLHFFRDPTSLFFDPARAYNPIYSAQRRVEADSYINDISRALNLSGTTVAHLRVANANVSEDPGSPRPKLCIGLATIARKEEHYFETAVGSLLDGLDAEERAQIHLKTFIAHTDPTVHPAYSEPWLYVVTDDVLTYQLDGPELEHIKKLEEERGLFREKALFDYAYLLDACKQTGAQYIAMVEDDVIAREGWYARTMKALKDVERKTREMGHENFLYLRLFYTEEYLGWNIESWPTYLFCSILAAAAPFSILLLLRTYPRRLKPTAIQYSITPTLLILTTLVYTPLLIILFFAAGSHSLYAPSPGVSLMPTAGCCSQAFVFPTERAGELVGYYKSKKVGFVDMLTEELANRGGENMGRWVLSPSVMQHIGGRSSKGDDWKNAKGGKNMAQRIWSFGFEEITEGVKG